jgi:hypothetical protein
MARQFMRLALGAALAMTFTLSAATVARANDECRQRLDNAKAKIDRDAARYGNDSRQVSKDVAKLDEQRQWCRDHHADWDHSLFDVGIYVHH